MKLTFAFLIIIFLAFSGYHLSFRKLKLPYFAGQFYLTGTEFIFLGLLLGPQFLDLLDMDIQKGLTPVVALVLGWIGLLIGFQFEYRQLKRFPTDFYLAAITESLLSLTLVFVCVYLTLVHWIHMPGKPAGGIALALAAVAGCTSQTGLALLPPGISGVEQRTIKLLRFISSMGGLTAIFFFATAFFINAAQGLPASAIGIPGLPLSAFSACLGLTLLFMLLLSRRIHEDTLILVVIGMTTLASGMALALHFSPLITNFFVGFCLVNLSRDKERIYQLLMPIEKPAYLFILVFLGVSFRLDSPWILLVAFIYCLYRTSARVLSGLVVTTLPPPLNTYSGKLGFGLLAQGGLPLAMLLDFGHAFQSSLSTNIISVAIIAVIYNEFLSPYFMARLLTRKT